MTRRGWPLIFPCTNGTLVEVHPTWVAIRLPDGTRVDAVPQKNAGQRVTSRRLGYGTDVDAMTRDHDPLHALLTDWLGLPFSHALHQAAGLPFDRMLAQYEEDAVLAVQRLMRHARLSIQDLITMDATVPTPPPPGLNNDGVLPSDRLRQLAQVYRIMSASLAQNSEQLAGRTGASEGHTSWLHEKANSELAKSEEAARIARDLEAGAQLLAEQESVTLALEGTGQSDDDAPAGTAGDPAAQHVHDAGTAAG